MGLRNLQLCDQTYATTGDYTIFEPHLLQELASLYLLASFCKILLRRRGVLVRLVGSIASAHQIIGTIILVAHNITRRL